jgi:transposase
MDVVHERCCGLDIHKRLVVACLVQPGANGGLAREVRSFGTTTAELLALGDWLAAAGCTHVAMESTGVFWKPIFAVLEGTFELLLVNAQHLKSVPGRKTDVRDAEWIADLLRHGLLRASFVPSREQRDLRDLTRQRSTLVAERARVVNRLQKVLEDTNLKLASVVTDIMGVSARAMLEALLAGESDPTVLAHLARGRLRSKRAQLEQALTGRLRPHHCFLLADHLGHIDYLDEAIARFGSEIAARLHEAEEDLTLLDSIPGVNRRIAEVFLAEVGANVSRFPSAAHLASWAGMCPGNHESAGKRLSGRSRKGNTWLRSMLIEAANGAAHTKDTYLRAQFNRLVTRRGKKRALVALGHSILVIAYHVLTRRQPYQDLGANYFDERDQQVVQRRLVRRLERLGFQVQLQPAVA